MFIIIIRFGRRYPHDLNLLRVSIHRGGLVFTTAISLVRRMTLGGNGLCGVHGLLGRLFAGFGLFVVVTKSFLYFFLTARGELIIFLARFRRLRPSRDVVIRMRCVLLIVDMGV